MSPPDNVLSLGFISSKTSDESLRIYSYFAEVLRSALIEQHQGFKVSAISEETVSYAFAKVLRSARA